MEYQKDNMIDVDYETMQQLVDVKILFNKIKFSFNLNK